MKDQLTCCSQVDHDAWDVWCVAARSVVDATFQFVCSTAPDLGQLLSSLKISRELCDQLIAISSAKASTADASQAPDAAPI